MKKTQTINTFFFYLKITVNEGPILKVPMIECVAWLDTDAGLSVGVLITKDMLFAFTLS